MNQLDVIVASRLRDVRARKARVPIEMLYDAARNRPPVRDFEQALRSGAPAIVAEFKRSSPSAGALADRDPAATSRAYQAGGAAALSILTEPSWFGGCLEDLVAARDATALPVLRKDFIVDEYQVWESAEAGADAILLIAAILTSDELAALRVLAQSLRMCAVVEVRDEQEARRALGAGATVIGINNRDLRTMRVDLQTALRMRRHLPAECTVIGESGYTRAADLAACAAAGIDAVLIGESLMRAADPAAAVASLRAVPI
ncbi:MAG TPA: indole-3-glycerol phosphate synthase TrpC [Candidatus Eremiobacteraceae bacterium]|nr:indole-3-glycerol phosphate synthase TrpC [Candidatus Eremiobacteraceae bacterium]